MGEGASRADQEGMENTNMSRRIKYTIQKTVSWESSHQLMGLPADHQCSRLHGHSYRADIELSGYELDGVGFLIDFGILGTMVRETLDHKHLNDVIPTNPTAENIAKWLVEVVMGILFKLQADTSVQLRRVRVYETATSWAEALVEEMA